jgi:hypothetical protein
MALELNELRLAVAPYDGPHLYPRVAVKYFLERGIARHEHITWAITASRSVPQRELKHTLEVAERVIEEVDATLVKEAVLSLIGLWGKPFGDAVARIPHGLRERCGQRHKRR